MTKIKAVKIGEDFIFVEVEPAKLSIAVEPSGAPLPSGAEAIGFEDKVVDAAAVIHNTVGALARTTLAALRSVQPDECTIEIGLSFKGEANPIPVLVKTGAEAALKVTAKWKGPTTS